MFNIEKEKIITKSDMLLYNLTLEQQKTNQLLAELIELSKPKSKRKRGGIIDG